MYQKNVIPNNLKKIREERGIQQKFVAEYLGLSANYYCQIENGHRNLPTKCLPKLQKLFGISLDEIFFNNEIAKCDKDKTA